MNLTTLTTWASRLTGDVSQTRFTGQYTDALNEAQIQFVLDSLCLFKDQAFSIVADDATYALPSDFMFEKKVTFATENSPVGGVKLEPISRATLEFYVKDHNWSIDEGTPKYYIIDPESARQELRLYPIPQAADVATSNLLLTYYAYPTALASGSDVPLNGNTLLQQFHIGIAAYAAWLLLSGEPATPEIMAKQAQLLGIYNGKAIEAKDRFGNTISEPLRLRGGRSWR